MKIHELKTIQPYFDSTWSNMKTFEVRKDDRDYNLGDLLLLKEYHVSNESYSGHEILAEITYILRDKRYVKEGYVILQFRELTRRYNA